MTLWQRRRWRFLLNVIDQLPAHSRYAEAVADDDELAASTLHDERKPTRPRLSTWSPVVAELRVLSERVGVLGQLVAVLSKNKYHPPALPRPETAYERVRRDYENERHKRVSSQLLPPEEG